MNIVYLVVAYEEYECNEIVKAYFSESEAEKFCEKCNAHNEKHPETPNIDECDGEWDEWDEVFEIWKRSHPANDFLEYLGPAQEYKVVKIKVNKSTRKGK